MKLFKTTCARLLFLLPLLVSEKSVAQSFTISPANTTFTANASIGITSPVTNSNAFIFDVNSGNTSYDLTASITAQNPAGVVFPANPFTVKFVSITGLHGKVTGQETADVQLIQSPPTHGNLALNATKTKNKTATWTYDLTLNPIGYSVPVGTYVFTVTIVYWDGSSTISRSFPITLNVQSVVDLSLIQNTSTTVNFGSSSAYTNGITLNNFHSLQVKSNMLWLINVAAQTPYFSSGSSGASNNMPCSVMKIRPNGTSTFIPLSTTATTIKTGSRGDVTAPGNTSSFDVNFDPGYNYNPGIYNLSLTYTLTNQ